MSMEHLSIKVENKANRVSQYGRDFLVVPMVIIVPGVLNGSKGPLYYPDEEVSRYPELWDHKPITIGHQDTRDLEVMNRSYVGFLYNTRYDKKLISDGWFDVLRTATLSPTIYNNLTQGIPFELSTGLSVDVVEVQNEGEYAGKIYKGVAKNYRPDHLAVLVDAVGACSIKDGCGVLVNELKTIILNRSPEDIRELSSLLTNLGENEMDREQTINYLVTNCSCWSGEGAREELSKMSDPRLKALYDGTVKAKNDEALLNAAKTGYQGEEGSYKFNEQTKVWEFIKNTKKPEPTPTPNPPNPNPNPTPTPNPNPNPTPPPSAVTKDDIKNALKDLSPADWWAMAPGPVQEEAAEVRRIANEAKSGLVQQWVDNAAPDQKETAKAWAEKQSLETLRTVVNSLPKKVSNNPYENGPDYSGRGGGVQNLDQLQKPEPLGQYEWDFSTPEQSAVR